jgi:hypothetical protein
MRSETYLFKKMALVNAFLYLVAKAKSRTLDYMQAQRYGPGLIGVQI